MTAADSVAGPSNVAVPVTYPPSGALEIQVEAVESPATTQNEVASPTLVSSAEAEGIMTPAMLVRRNVFLRVLRAVAELGLHRRLLLAFKSFMTISQVCLHSRVTT